MYNKKRTFITLLGIIIAVSALTGVSHLGESGRSFLKRNETYKMGNWELRFRDVPVDKQEVITKDKSIKMATFSKDLGYALLEDGKNKDKPYVYVKALDSLSFENQGIHLLSGRLPENSNEVVIPSNVKTNGGAEWNINDQISLSLGNRQTVDYDPPEYDLNQNQGFLKENEKLVPSTTKEYTVVGIVERWGQEEYQAPGYTIFTYLDDKELRATKTIDISTVTTGYTYMIEEYYTRLAKAAGMKNMADELDAQAQPWYNIDVNGGVLSYSEPLYLIGDSFFAGSEYMGYNITRMQIFLYIILMISGISFIYNTFSISLAERSRDLGILSSVGATKRQERNCVLWEGFLLGVVGIPLGLLLGSIGIGITINLINPMLMNIRNVSQPFYLVISWQSIVISVVLMAVTILISACLPAIRAGKITPIEAIRMNRDIQIKSKDIRVNFFVKKLGFKTVLALKNITRHKRRYRITVLSIAVSMILFLGVASYSAYSLTSDSLSTVKYNYDASIRNLNREECDFIYPEVVKLQGITQSAITHTSTQSLDKDFLVEHRSDEFVKQYPVSSSIYENDMQVEVRSYDKKFLEEYANQLGIDVKTLYDTKNPQAILVNYMVYNSGNETKSMAPFKTKKGDPLLISGKNLTIGAVTNQLPFGYSSKDVSIYVIVSDPVLDSMTGFMDSRIFVKTDDLPNINSTLKSLEWNYIDNNIVVDNPRNDIESAIQSYQVRNILNYGYIFLIACICLANIVNIITNNLSLRRKEAAVLKSIGMTDEELRKMLLIESGFYGIYALLFALPLSLCLNIFIRGYYFREIYNLIIPWGPMFIAIGTVFIIICTTFYYSVSKLADTNIAAELRE